MINKSLSALGNVIKVHTAFHKITDRSSLWRTRYPLVIKPQLSLDKFVGI
jgi:hypothetical protein